MSDVAVLRARAEAHQEALDRETRFLTLADLAKRWSLSIATVRLIPRDELPFLEFGSGAKHKHRRFRPDDVAAYEASRR